MKETIEKLKKEMSEHKNNNLIQAVGAYLSSAVLADQELANTIRESGKTLEDIAKEITAYARTKAKNGMAMLTDQDVYDQAIIAYKTKKEKTSPDTAEEGESNNAVSIQTQEIETGAGHTSDNDTPVKNVAQEKPVKPIKTNTLETNQISLFDFGK